MFASLLLGLCCVLVLVSADLSFPCQDEHDTKGAAALHPSNASGHRELESLVRSSDVYVRGAHFPIS